MNALAIDTATEVLSVAASAGEHLERRVLVSRRASLRHTNRLMEYVRFALDELHLTVRDLDFVACMRGPGSFTGLRIGMATAKGLAQAIAGHKGLSKPPLVSVDTLATMAVRHRHGRQIVLPVIDGRKNRYYCAAYRGEELLLPSSDLTVEAVVDALSAYHAETIIVTGPHAESFLGRAREAGGNGRNISGYSVDEEYIGAADSLLSLAGRAAIQEEYDPLGFGPIYLRRSDAQIGAQL